MATVRIGESEIAVQGELEVCVGGEPVLPLLRVRVLGDHGVAEGSMSLGELWRCCPSLAGKTAEEIGDVTIELRPGVPLSGWLGDE